MGTRNVELLREGALAKARAEMAAQLRPRREYVKVLRERREIAFLFFTANTFEENGAAGRVKALLEAHPGARAVVLNRCHGALEGVPAIWEHDPRAAAVDEDTLEPAQRRLLAQLAETGTRVVLEGDEKRLAGQLARLGLVVRYSAEKPTRFKISSRGLELVRGGS